MKNLFIVLLLIIPASAHSLYRAIEDSDISTVMRGMRYIDRTRLDKAIEKAQLKQRQTANQSRTTNEWLMGLGSAILAGWGMSRMHKSFEKAHLEDTVAMSLLTLVSLHVLYMYWWFAPYARYEQACSMTSILKVARGDDIVDTDIIDIPEKDNEAP